MKRILTSASLSSLSALVLTLSSAHAADPASWKDITPAQRHGAMRVIRCARDLTEKGGAFPGGTIAAEALQRSEASFRGLIEQASDMIYNCDLSGHFTFINPTALSLSEVRRRGRP